MKYTIVSKYHPDALRLINVGYVLGTPARRLKKGDYIMYNYGAIYQVTDIIKETEKTLTVEVTAKQGIYTQKFFKDRLICILHETDTI